MKLQEILFQIWALRLYSEDEWAEYVGNFSDREGILARIKQQVEPTQDLEILQRIKREQGVAPSQIDYTKSPKIILQGNATHPNDVTIGIVSGCYDVLHLNHIRSMAFAKQYLQQYPNPKLYVLTLSDENICAKKGPSRPILDANERLEMICGVACVDYVIPLQDPNCLQTLNHVRPDYFFKARADNAQGIVLQEMELVKSYGGQVVVFPHTEGRKISTTSLIQEVLWK